MQIQLRSFVNSSLASFNERIVPSLSVQQKKIAMIAALIFGILAVILIYYFNNKLKKPSNIVVEVGKSAPKKVSLEESDAHEKKTITLGDGVIEAEDFNNEKLHGCSGTQTFSDGKADREIRVTGQFLNGELVHEHDNSNGLIKQGDFKGVLLNGKGKKNEGGISEEGDFKEGKLHGTGRRHSIEIGEYLEGEFVEGTCTNGTKTCSTQTGNSTQSIIWQGEFKDNQLVKGKKRTEKPQIRGEEKNEIPESVEEGTFIDELLHGEGTRTLAEEIQKGEFEKGFLIEGTRTLTNGIIEEGTFENGLFIRGKKFLLNGILEEGEFKDGMLIKGMKTLDIGKEEEGTFKNGLLHGLEGRSRWEDDSKVYESIGEWKRGQLIMGKTKIHSKSFDELPNTKLIAPLNGQGKRIWSDGSEEEGEFKDNKLNGQGKKTKPRLGRIDEGEFKDNKLHGKGKRTFCNENIIQEGNFENGKLINGK